MYQIETRTIMRHVPKRYMYHNETCIKMRLKILVDFLKNMR